MEITGNRAARTPAPQVLALWQEYKRSGDVKHSLADITRAREKLGYEPRISFEEGLARAVDWYRSLAAPSARTTHP